MHILDTRIDHAGRLQILVDRLARCEDLTWSAYPYDLSDRHGRRAGVIYLAVDEPSGLVSFLADTGNPEGYNGAVFTLPMHDGTVRRVHGPWSSNPGFVQQITGLGLHRDDVCLHDEANRDSFERGAGGHVFHLTAAAAPALYARALGLEQIRLDDRDAGAAGDLRRLLDTAVLAARSAQLLERATAIERWTSAPGAPVGAGMEERPW
ncbi:hypothetical protein [Actinoplanes sp. G11-F43]|uniref:hypothetical protein n=1 Tax=Actinoplanes sp. G11-F43 TaxID=3424130 RepID=UPI003D33FE06